jgi:hypothetical protein
LRSGYSPDDAPIEECSDVHEAQKIADHYARIVRLIEEQVEAQRA